MAHTNTTTQHMDNATARLFTTRLGKWLAYLEGVQTAQRTPIGEPVPTTPERPGTVRGLWDWIEAAQRSDSTDLQDLAARCEALVQYASPGMPRRPAPTCPTAVARLLAAWKAHLEFEKSMADLDARTAHLDTLESLEMLLDAYTPDRSGHPVPAPGAAWDLKALIAQALRIKVPGLTQTAVECSVLMRYAPGIEYMEH